MKKTVVSVFLCWLAGLGVAQAQLKIDFTVTGGAVEPGWQGYFGTDKAPATFTAQSYAAFGTTVTIKCAWVPTAVTGAIRMIDRGTDDGMDPQDLLRDWIGTDTRSSPGDPMTLTITGLPGGTYQWVSYHHDPQDQTGIFDLTVSDAAGSKTITGTDISNGVNFKLADVTKLTTTIVSDGKADITLVFHQTSPSATTALAIFVMNAFELTAVDTGVAMLPVPASGAADVLRDGTVLSWAAGQKATAHDVYLGTDPNAVAAATTASQAYRGRQNTSSIDPGRLNLGATYYWRVDEVQADGTVVKGYVWSFTAEPVAIPLVGGRITATASSAANANEGPEKTIDGSGLSAAGLHGVDTNTMWSSALTDPGPVWIRYEFDRSYKLHQMLVWNHNTNVEPLVGFGAKDVTIEYSSDGTTWTALGTVAPIARAPGAAGYAANTTIDFGGVAAKSVRITITSNWGGLVKRFGLSEVRFLVIPASARQPQPASGAANVDPRTLLLSWRAGRDAAKHQVYLGTDVNEVRNGTALAGTATKAEFAAGALLQLGRTYYWKINEVNDLGKPSTWEGEIWSLSTVAALTVDNMESYNDDENKGTRIYETWIDGFDNPKANGAVVGNDQAPFAEKTLIHGGSQSLPLRYDNTTAAFSEAVRTFDPPQDWTAYGVKGLTLWFCGNETNTATKMYVKINGQKVTFGGEAQDVLRKGWHFWYIDLSAVAGASLKKVTELTLGFEGGKGIVLFDDIALSPADHHVVTPVEPARTGLVAQYAFEGNANDSTGAHPLTVTGAPKYTAGKVGQAIKLDGVRDFLTSPGTYSLPTYSVSVWLQVEGGTGARDILSAYEGTNRHGILLEITATGTVRYLHRAPLGTSGGRELISGTTYADGAWYHVAIVRSADTMTLYLNGELVGSRTDAIPFDAALSQLTVGVLQHASPSRFFPGSLDELYVYGRDLSAAEVAGLAGRTQPFDQP